MRRLYLCTIVALLAVGACGDDDTADGGADPSQTTRESETSAPGGGDDDATVDGGEPTGTATIDGTDYTIVASLQCLVALDQANQISISGEVAEYESEDPVQWSYSWDSDDGVNEFDLTASDELEYTTFNVPEWDEPQVAGTSVSASGTVSSPTGAPVEASFEIDCAAG